MTISKIRIMTITAIFMSILLIQTLVPNIGYVRILPTLPAITTIPLTIAVYSSILGPKNGFILGMFWGLSRLLVAYTQPGDLVSMLLFRNVFISIVPSICAGLFPGLISKFITDKNRNLIYLINGAITSLTNTVFVIFLTWIVFINNPSQLLQYLGNTSSSSSLFLILIVSLGLNGISEMIFTAIVTPLICKPLHIILKRS